MGWDDVCHHKKGYRERQDGGEEVGHGEGQAALPPLKNSAYIETFWKHFFWVAGQEISMRTRLPLPLRETLCESGRWIDALKKGGRVLKKRGRVLKKRGRFLRSGV